LHQRFDCRSTALPAISFCLSAVAGQNFTESIQHFEVPARSRGIAVTASIAEYTVSEQILLAAYNMDKHGETTFTAEALVVAAWKQFPRTFGLRGYADQYPDSNKVLTSIMGERGLARRGWLVKIGQKIYSMTREGRRVGARLLQEEETPAGPELFALPREKEAFLRHLLTSTAVRKFESNQKADLAFADACRFWDITQNLRGEAVDERLQFAERMLNELEQDLSQHDAQLHSGRTVTAGDVRVLHNIHRYMVDRFERILNLLRSRETKR
jgi:hypothetical protein